MNSSRLLLLSREAQRKPMCVTALWFVRVPLGIQHYVTRTIMTSLVFGGHLSVSLQYPMSSTSHHSRPNIPELYGQMYHKFSTWMRASRIDNLIIFLSDLGLARHVILFDHLFYISMKDVE